MENIYGDNGMFTLVSKIMKSLSSIRELGISADDDPQYDLIGILKKIESNVNYLAEARDHLDRALDAKALQGKSSITKFEADHRKFVRDQKTALNNQRQKEYQEMVKKKQAEEAEKLKNMKKKTGKKVQARSTKPVFKQKETKKHVWNEEEQDEFDYLDEKIFKGLQEYKKDPEKFEMSARGGEEEGSNR